MCSCKRSFSNRKTPHAAYYLKTPHAAYYLAGKGSSNRKAPHAAYFLALLLGAEPGEAVGVGCARLPPGDEATVAVEAFFLAGPDGVEVAVALGAFLFPCLDVGPATGALRGSELARPRPLAAAGRTVVCAPGL